LKKLLFIPFILLGLVLMATLVIGPFCGKNHGSKRDSFGFIYQSASVVAKEEEKIYLEEFPTHGNHVVIKYLDQYADGSVMSVMEVLLSTGINHIFFAPGPGTTNDPFLFADMVSNSTIYGYGKPLPLDTPSITIIPDYKQIANKIIENSGMAPGAGIQVIFHREIPFYMQLALDELQLRGFKVDISTVISETSNQITFEMEKLLSDNYKSLVAAASLANLVNPDSLPDIPVFILEIAEKNKLPLFKSVTIPCGGDSFARRVSGFVPIIENGRALPLVEITRNEKKYQLLLINSFD
jgi:hypothetical protein